MERYCKVITDQLWNTAKADELFGRGVESIDEIAQGNFHRDNIRTEEFTKRLIARCGRGGAA
jgi:hypothetical protein